MENSTKKILVLGGGYSGMMAAIRLAGKTRRMAVEITLVNGLDHFVERPRLHEKATGVQLNDWSIPDLLRGTGVRFVRGWVTTVAPDQRQITVDTDAGVEQMTFDYLVYALGSRVDRSSVPGVAEHTFTLDSTGAATVDQLACTLAEFGDSPFRVAIIGGGPTGVEAATEIKAAHSSCDVELITQGQVGDFKGALVQRHVEAALREQRIGLHQHQRVQAVEAGRVLFDEGYLEADLIIWAGGFMAPSLARDAGLAVNARQQLLVDPTLRSPANPSIFGVGDGACPIEAPGAPWRMSLFSSLVSGAQVADNIAADLRGKPMKPLSLAWYGQGVSLGPVDAVGFAAYPNDVAWSFVLRRKLAVNVRNLFVWYAGAVLRFERRWPGLFFWNGKGRYLAQQRRQVMQSQSTTKA